MNKNENYKKEKTERDYKEKKRDEENRHCHLLERYKLFVNTEVLQRF